MSTNPILRTIRISLTLLVIGVIICPRPPAAHEVDPKALLAKVSQAQSAVSYSAFATITIDGLKPCSVNYRMRHGKVSVRTLLGYYYIRSFKAMEKLIAADLPDLSSIIPLVEGKDTIADRPAWVLRLKPRVRRTPWTQLWVDQDSGAVLAFRNWDGKGKLLQSMRVTSIDIQSITSEH